MLAVLLLLHIGVFFESKDILGLELAALPLSVELSWIKLRCEGVFGVMSEF